MKIRQGFVSNSSSSCFVVWGNTIPLPEVPFEQREELEKLGMTWLFHRHGTTIGRCPKNMKDEERLKEFKEKIAFDINSVIPDANLKPEDICWVEEVCEEY